MKILRFVSVVVSFWVVCAAVLYIGTYFAALVFAEHGSAAPGFAEHGSAAPGQADTLQWQQEVDQSLALHGHHGVIWKFNFDQNLSKPHFHPVALPTGEVLTCSRPSDHPWHYALWFSWKYINGVNYWEEDRQTGQAQGKTSWSNVNIETDENGRAHIVMRLDYHTQDDEPVLTEKRTLRISAPDNNSQSYNMDWTSTFTAGAVDVTLERTPLPPDPNGKSWGGYAGLSIRFAENLTQRQAFSASSPVEFNNNSIHRSHDTAMDYSGLVGERPAGIALLDHADNPRYPTPWYVIRTNMSYLNAAFLTYKPYMLQAGESFTLRYRIIVHAKRWNSATLENACKQYAALAKTPPE